MEKHRAEKAEAKAKGDAAAQAAASVKLGVDHAKIGERKARRISTSTSRIAIRPRRSRAKTE